MAYGQQSRMRRGVAARPGRSRGMRPGPGTGMGFGRPRRPRNLRGRGRGGMGLGSRSRRGRGPVRAMRGFNRGIKTPGTFKTHVRPTGWSTNWGSNNTSLPTVGQKFGQNNNLPAGQIQLWRDRNQTHSPKVGR